MSGDEPVIPGEVPVFTGNEADLDAKVKALSGHGPKISTAGSDIHTTFGGLRAFYQAPEADQLFATTKPVADKALRLSSDMCVISGALGTYAEDIRPLVKRLNELRVEAEKFRTRIADDDKWREDGDLIDENLARRNEIAEVWTQFQEAERSCHSKIIALVCGTPLKVNDGSNAEGMYGYDAEALKQSESLPWGDAVEESIPWWQVWEHAWEFGKGVIVDGVWGTIKGLGTLVGVDGWDAAGQAWTGLGKLLTGVVITVLPTAGIAYWAAPDSMLPSWLRDSRTAMKETGKALVAWDQWGSNPARAAGGVTFNVLTTVFTGGTGGAAAGAGKAGAAAKTLSLAGKTGRVIDPMTYVFKGAGAGLAKVGDLMTGLKGVGTFEVPNINIDGAVALPNGSKMLPDGTIHLPSGTAVPEGALRLPDGNIKLPEGTVTFPPGTVKLPVDGPGQFLDPAGHIYDAEGALIQRAEDAPKGNPAAGADTSRTDAPNPNAPATATVPERELAAAGARGGDNTIRLESSISDPIRHADSAPDLLSRGDHTPGAHPNTTPGGHAPDHLPGSHADNGMPRNDLNAPRGGHSDPTPPNVPHTDGPPTGSGRPDGPTPATHPETPGGAGHADGPGGAGHTDSPGTGGAHPGTPGSGSLDDLAVGARGSVKRPDFMLDGPNPYGERGRLTKEQIEEIQVYRANEEPGYREQYYNKLGRRLRLNLKDESGFTPPHLTRLAHDAPWIRAKDTPEPPQPHFLDDDYKPLGRGDVQDSARLETLDEFTQKRHAAVTWDNLVSEWKSSTGRPEAEKVYKASHTAMKEATEEFGEAAAEYHFVAEHYPDFVKQELLGPANGNHQFDQVWLHEDRRALVIEAKSNVDTPLGKRDLPGPPNVPGVKGAAVSQGSREYLFDIFREMTKRGEIELVSKLVSALKEGKLDYVVVKGEKNTGSYTGLQYRRFDVSKGTLP
ncbi:hypothetical protein ACFYXM_35185 [Streptomyces sp. NPDC002476]|uniref:hypothetical protein n=1 Tax=Streptomyces sp. NPDC002476 TaxID=3364648 RepID=UPI0036C546B8